MSARELWVVECGHAGPRAFVDREDADHCGKWFADETATVTRYTPALTPEREEEIVRECVDIALEAASENFTEVRAIAQVIARHALKMARGES